MADELPTTDRDALVRQAIRALVCNSNLPDWMQIRALGQDMRPLAELTVDALLPHLATLLDRARQQGRAEVIEAITKSPPSLEELLAGTEFEAALARGSQTAPSATENAETGGGA